MSKCHNAHWRAGCLGELPPLRFYIGYILELFAYPVQRNLPWSSGHDFRLSTTEVDKRGRPGFDSPRERFILKFLSSTIIERAWFLYAVGGEGAEDVAEIVYWACVFVFIAFAEYVAWILVTSLVRFRRISITTLSFSSERSTYRPYTRLSSILSYITTQTERVLINNAVPRDPQSRD